MHLAYLLALFCGIIFTAHSAFATIEAADNGNIPLLAKTASKAGTGLTLEKVIATALTQSPRLQGVQKSTNAARSARDQAGAWPNPEIGVGAENFAGSGPYGSFTSAELNYGVSQQLPITGKLDARKAIAEAGVSRATLDEEAARLDVIRDTTIAFMAVVAAEESVYLATEQKELAADVLQSVSRRVGAAAAPLIQRSRSEVEYATAILALDKASRERDISRHALAAIIGQDVFEASLAKEVFYEIEKPAPLANLRPDDPLIDRLRQDSTLAQARARIELEQANALPDPRVSVGVREFQATDDRALLVSLAMPIPIFDLNGGNIEKARQEALRTELDNKQASRDRTAEVSRAHARLMRSFVEVNTLKNSILPSATQAFRLSREGYTAGRFPYLEVLDAQRSLFLARQQKIDALREFHTAKAELTRLIAKAPAKPSQSGEHHAE
ncbi:MAG: TolC family protein [Alphaproteobacteria bacterium]|nr:TolC family protein [Alphaproteobacteria bacterium]